jgi:hypothetical protein
MNHDQSLHNRLSVHPVRRLVGRAAMTAPDEIAEQASIQISREQRAALVRTIRPVYPRGFFTPSGRPVSIRTMSHALREIRRRDIDLEYPGWEWYPMRGTEIIRDFQNGLDDRINRR